MDEKDRLMIKKQELEQLIRYNQEFYSESSRLSGQLSSYASHPADIASHLQVLNIELEKINGALAHYNQDQVGQNTPHLTELH